MLISEENSRNDLEEEFDNWVADFITKAYSQMDKSEYKMFCSNLENILAQYTDPNFFDYDAEDGTINGIRYEDDDAWFNESYTRGDLVKFNLGRRRNDIHNGVIMRARNGKYTVRDENGDNVEISDEMIIEKLEPINESLLERRMNLGSPWHHWTEVYNIFETISDMYPSSTSGGNVAEKKIDDFYDIFKGIKEVDTAYNRWQSQ